MKFPVLVLNFREASSVRLVIQQTSAGGGSSRSFRNAVSYLNVTGIVNGVECRCYIFSRFSWDNTPGVKIIGVESKTWSIAATVQRTFFIYKQIRIPRSCQKIEVAATHPRFTHIKIDFPPILGRDLLNHHGGMTHLRFLTFLYLKTNSNIASYTVRFSPSSQQSWRTWHFKWPFSTHAGPQTVQLFCAFDVQTKTHELWSQIFKINYKRISFTVRTCLPNQNTWVPQLQTMTLREL